MNLKKDNKRFLYIFTTFILAFILISYIYIEEKEKSLIHENYTKLSTDIKSHIVSFVDNKKNSTAAIALPIANSDKLISAFKSRDFSDLRYKSLKFALRNNTNYKNLWIEVFDKDFISLYRSWTDNMEFKKFDTKNFKPFDGVKKSIEITWYGLTFKAVVPVYENRKKLGYIQTITKFNSIAKNIQKQGFTPIILVDKKYKKSIKRPFTNSFVGDYYVANLDASNDILEKLDEDKISVLKDLDSYTIFENYFVTKQKVEDGIGYIFAFKKIDEIDTSLITNFKKQAFLLVFILLFSLIFIVSIYSYNSYTRNIKKLNTNLLSIVKRLRRQRNKTQLLLDSQSSIIIITDGEEIVNANKRLLEFFTDCRSLLEFKEKYRCVCTAFIDMDDERYLVDIDYNGNNWAEHVMANPEKSFKAAIYDENKNTVHFKVSVSMKSFDSYIIATLVDITHEIKLQNEAKQKDKLIFQQSKMSSIAQILHNIAHHWRQPLNVITTASSSMKLYNQMKTLDDEKLNSNCDLILNKANYLSSTIDDFKDFFLVRSSKLETKNIASIIKQTVNYLDVVIEDYSIDVKLELDKNVNKEIYENEFKQALLKMLDNSIELLYQRKNEDERVIIIKLTDNTLSIKDCANGVDKSSLDKLFEPYYTTKHQAVGVGLGLYNVQQILTNQMNFEVSAANCSFEYNNKNQKGLEIVVWF
ncbi:MAG: sensor histidine kinase [Campylobacterota bacterium]